MYRFIDTEGHEHELSGVQAFARAVRDGHIGPDTLVYSDETGRWQPASRLDVYVLAETGEPPADDAVAAPAPEPDATAAPAPEPDAPAEGSSEPAPSTRHYCTRCGHDLGDLESLRTTSGLYVCPSCELATPGAEHPPEAPEVTMVLNARPASSRTTAAASSRPAEPGTPEPAPWHKAWGPDGRLLPRATRRNVAFWTVISGAFYGLTIAGAESALAPLAALGLLATSVVTVVASIGRFHDTGQYGWWAVLTLVPLVNLAVFAYLVFAEPVPGPNRFGADPRWADEGAADRVASR